MSFEEYAQQLTKKFKLAVAVAVLRNKPVNLSPEQYIVELKENIKKHDAETDSANLILTGDFNFDDNDFNFDENDDPIIVNEFNESFNTEEQLTKENNDINIVINNEANKNANVNEVQEIGSVNLLEDFNVIQEINRNDVAKEVEVTILSDDNTDDTNSLEDILRTLRDIDENKVLSQKNSFPKRKKDNPALIPCKSDTIFSIQDAEVNMTICNNLPDKIMNISAKNDKQITVDEEIRARVVKNLNKCTISAKLNEMNETQSLILRQEDDKEENVFFKNTYDMEVDMALNEIRGHEKQYDDPNLGAVREKVAIVRKNIDKELFKNAAAIDKDEEDIYDKTNVIDNANKKRKINSVENAFDNTQDTILYTLHGFTQDASQITQSQLQNMVIPQAFIYGSKNGDKETHKNKEHNQNETTTNDNTRITCTDDELGKNYKNACSKGLSQNPTVKQINSNEIQYIIDGSGQTYAVLHSIELGKGKENENYKAMQSSTEDVDKEPQAISKKNNTKANKEGSQRHEDTTEKNTENDEANTEQFETRNTDEIVDLEMTDTEEVIPFKVIKELSKVKAYLNRRERKGSTDGFSSDSGYRSDSQSSFKTRISDDWVHQSANCLYGYLVNCPLVNVTQEIVAEISQVLGRLIDRLHEEERYPAFLEELLERVDTLLRELSTAGTFEHILLEKDETIQRLLLLNKSTHILKFSLEKIAKCLEQVHCQLISDQNLYELTKIEDVENLRYVFYVLEMFIQMYGKVKDSFSQSTQNSQETKLLKKSSITDIWRKKWKPDYKEAKIASQEKSCVLSKCGDVLNKIIVDCMEGYSLVSFAALQCFNLLQN